MIKHLEKRFAELEQQLKSIEATKKTKYSEYSGQEDHIDDDAFLNWCVKARSLIANSCGVESQHFAAFIKAGEVSMYTTNYAILRRAKAVFLAAKEDFEGGYLTSVKGLAQAEVFDSELEQASELLSAGYASAAAVIAGVVLETNLRNLCSTHNIPIGKLDRMNADLAKNGTYNALTQKRITALAGVRNSAAHGKNEEFTVEDVKAMISEVERLISTWLA